MATPYPVVDYDDGSEDDPVPGPRLSIYCPDCGYLLSVHPDRCPDEAEARAAFGDR